MPRYKALVYTNALPGKDADFNRWYDEVHVPEVVQMTKAVAAQRFALTDHQQSEAPPQRYLTIYEFDCDPKEFSESLNVGAGKMDLGDSLDSKSASVVIYDTIGERFTE